MSLLNVRQRYSPCHVEVESQQHNQQNIEAPGDLNSLRTSSSLCLQGDTSWRRKLESCLWIASAAFIVYYGDFRTNLLLLLATDTRIHRMSFNLGLICFILSLATMFYVVYQLHNHEKPEDRLLIAQGMVPAAAITGTIGFILFSHALWPIWSFLTIPMLFTLFMALVVVAPYVAPYANVRLDVDALRGIYIRASE